MSDQQQLTKGIASHGMWKQRLVDAIENGKSEWQPETVCQDDQCEFGKWLYSCTPQDRASEHYPKVKRLHAEFHKVAANVLQLALNKEREDAEKAIGHGSKYADISSELTRSMMEWKKTLI